MRGNGERTKFRARVKNAVDGPCGEPRTNARPVPRRISEQSIRHGSCGRMPNHMARVLILPWSRELHTDRVVYKF